MKNTFESKGRSLREEAKSLVLEYMKNQSECRPSGGGIKQAVIFREVGLDWGSYDRATSSNQQYWIVALLNNLAEEKLIEQDIKSKHWRLK
jgi:hypothetical protein